MVPFLQVFLPHESSFVAFLLSERGLRLEARTCSLKMKRFASNQGEYLGRRKSLRRGNAQTGKVQQVDRSATVQTSCSRTGIPSCHLEEGVSSTSEAVQRRQ